MQKYYPIPYRSNYALINSLVIHILKAIFYFHYTLYECRQYFHVDPHGFFQECKEFFFLFLLLKVSYTNSIYNTKKDLKIYEKKILNVVKLKNLAALCNIPKKNISPYLYNVAALFRESGFKYSGSKSLSIFLQKSLLLTANDKQINFLHLFY